MEKEQRETGEIEKQQERQTYRDDVLKTPSAHDCGAALYWREILWTCY